MWDYCDLASSQEDNVAFLVYKITSRNRRRILFWFCAEMQRLWISTTRNESLILKLNMGKNYLMNSRTLRIDKDYPRNCILGFYISIFEMITSWEELLFKLFEFIIVEQKEECLFQLRVSKEERCFRNLRNLKK